MVTQSALCVVVTLIYVTNVTPNGHTECCVCEVVTLIQLRMLHQTGTRSALCVVVTLIHITNVTPTYFPFKDHCCSHVVGPGIKHHTENSQS